MREDNKANAYKIRKVKTIQKDLDAVCAKMLELDSMRIRVLTYRKHCTPANKWFCPQEDYLDALASYQRR